MKKCFSCKQLKKLTEFGSDKGKTDGKSTYCLICARKRDFDYYRLHQKSRYAQYTERKKRVRRENSQKLWEYLRSHPCIDCGEKDILVLQFDHIRDKKNTISQMVLNGFKWETILMEIEKCNVRCANCHTRKTAKEQGWLKFLIAG